MEVAIGTAAGILGAIVCTVFYFKGLRDGAKDMKEKRTQKQEVSAADKELERKFDVILDYDPYGNDMRERDQGEDA